MTQPPRCMLLIDADNVSADVIQQAIDTVMARHGAIHVRRAYCTAEAAVTHAKLFKSLSIRPIVNLSAGKNSNDIALAVDAIDLAIAERPAVDEGFIRFTGRGVRRGHEAQRPGGQRDGSTPLQQRVEQRGDRRGIRCLVMQIGHDLAVRMQPRLRPIDAAQQRFQRQVAAISLQAQRTRYCTLLGCFSGVSSNQSGYFLNSLVEAALFDNKPALRSGSTVLLSCKRSPLRRAGTT